MTLKTTYERFLSSPNSSSLSDTATLHYVTTLKTYTNSGPIVRHLDTQNKNIVKKNSENIITTVEGDNSIALEVETTLEFISNGGAYLPGLDNFIVDRIATIPITHIVQFDEKGKIGQIRLTWDQGSLLRQVEIIGTRGKNWPITDGKDQIRLITTSSSSAIAAAPRQFPTRGRADESNDPPRRDASPSKKYIKDPHASLDLYDPPKDDENRRPTTSSSNTVAPRKSAKPPPREYSELFAAGNEDLAPSPNGSPSKLHRESIIAPKGAGARRHQSSNLFQEEQDFKEPKIYKTNPARYNHFDIGDPVENDAMQFKTEPKPEPKNVHHISRTNKNATHWNFEDFATPEKVAPRYREQDQVHFSLADNTNQSEPTKAGGQGAKGRKDAETHFDFLDDGTPIQKRPAQPKARKDAELHFEFRDDPTPAPRRIIGRTKAAAGLYTDPLGYDEHEDEDAPLSTVTNNAGRRKDMDSHWEAADDSPSDGNVNKKVVGENRMKAVKSMGAQWDNHDQSPQKNKKPAAGRGRQGLTSSWGFED